MPSVLSSVLIGQPGSCNHLAFFPITEIPIHTMLKGHLVYSLCCEDITTI